MLQLALAPVNFSLGDKIGELTLKSSQFHFNILSRSIDYTLMISCR
jgi:hypothetical protein